jgi:hypothetical protein
VGEHFAARAREVDAPKQGGFMRSTKKLAIVFSVIFLFLGGLVVTSEAQTRGGRRVIYRRPVVVGSYWGSPWYGRSWYGGGFYDPFYDPYLNDPYLRAQRDRWYKEKDVKDAAKKLREDSEKYRKDGVLTAKEQEKLMKRRQDYAKKVEKLNKFNRDN